MGVVGGGDGSLQVLGLEGWGPVCRWGDVGTLAVDTPHPFNSARPQVTLSELDMAELRNAAMPQLADYGITASSSASASGGKGSKATSASRSIRLSTIDNFQGSFPFRPIGLGFMRVGLLGLGFVRHHRLRRRRLLHLQQKVQGDLGLTQHSAVRHRQLPR